MLLCPRLSCLVLRSNWQTSSWSITPSIKYHACGDWPQYLWNV